MKITLFGTGYVGLVTGTCFADEGNQVLCVDIDEKKIAGLQKGEVPIFEPGLEELLERNVEAGRLSFTTDAKQGVEHGEAIFIAVGTPEGEDGSADMRHVFSVAETIGQYLTEYKVIVDKSTVPVGTASRVKSIIQQELDERGLSAEFDVLSNPEFLKEGAAVQDFKKPDRVVIGSDSERATSVISSLYKPFQRNVDRTMVMDVISAELTKYAANVMLATKVSLMNELSCISDSVGADIELVRKGMGADHRIGYHFIYPGCGFGGSCFPKDLAALAKKGKEAGCGTSIMDSVLHVNEQQKKVIPKKVKDHFGEIQGKTFAIWGLSFKPNTDDMREAPSRVLLEYLWDHGAKVQAFDPEAMEATAAIYGERRDLVFSKSHEAALKGADALIVMTEWSIFRNPDFESIKSTLKEPIIFDGRNIYDPNKLREAGITYYGIGRGHRAASCAEAACE